MGAGEVRILIVDDDEDMRATLAEFVVTLGVEVTTAAEVAEARRLLLAAEKPFDIVLTDLKLPDGSGLDVLLAARDRSKESLITIVTGYASLDTAVAAIRAGAYDYMTKPFTLDEIGVQVRNMVNRVSLGRENAQLSLRLQESYRQLDLLRRKRSETARLQDEIRGELKENSRKLDLLLELLTATHPNPSS